MQTQDGKQRDDLQNLQRRLDSKIRIISPAIDMIELITARGNTSLESCVSLTKSLRADIQDLGSRLASAASDEEASTRNGSKASSKHHREQEMQVIIAEMKILLQRLEDAVPLINLAITTSGVSLSTTLPASISPSRLLQASTFISAGDAAYIENHSRSTQIGPAFTLSMYMLFQGHANNLHDEEGLRHATWQEVVHKARIKLIRTPINRLGRFAVSTQAQRQASSDTPIASTESDEYFPSSTPHDEFAYQLTLVEDLEDDRVHTFDDDEIQPGSYDDVNMAGIREVIPVHQISRIFYADTGKILNINTEGESNSPILLLKRDIHAVPPRKMMSTEADDVDGSSFIGDAADKANAQEDTSEPSERPPQRHRSQWQLPPGLDPEWIALEVYVEEPDSDTASDSARDDSPAPRPQVSRHDSSDTYLTTGLSGLRLSSSPAPGTPHHLIPTNGSMTTTAFGASLFPANFNSFLTRSGAGIRTSLSLLEMLIRLTSLQQFQQASHLTINDELLNFFLVESSSTGATGDTDQRKRVRMDARQKVGFDPYNESPIKRHGEQYQYRQNGDSRETSRASTPSTISQATPHTFDSSPIVMRNRQLLSKTRAGTPETPTKSPLSSPPQRTPAYDPLRQSVGSLATPPGTTKSREAFLREEASSVREGKRSPLIRQSSSSDEEFTDT